VALVVEVDPHRIQRRLATRYLDIGVVRHADAGYELAIETAKAKDIQMPMIWSAGG
jgi:urocanate hydratase